VSDIYFETGDNRLMKRPDYRTLQALDAVIRERGFERAAQKLCITQSAVSQRIKQLENLFGQPLLVRTVPPRPTEQGQKLLALLHQVELLEEEWLGNDNINENNDTPLLLSLAVNADSLATWLLPALKSVLVDSPIRLNMQVEDETRTQERLRRGEVVGAVSIQPQALPSCLVDRLGALDYLFVASKGFAERYFPNGVTRSALLKAPAVAFDHLDDMHQAFLQQNFGLPPGSVPCHIVNSSEAFVQLARQGTTCCMIPHLQIEQELDSGELIDLTPGLFQRRMLYWHRFAPESRMMRKVTDALLAHGHQVLRQD
jgi:LysR family transcriptional regulator (chromosome initiation inhibitor)